MGSYGGYYKGEKKKQKKDKAVKNVSEPSLVLPLPEIISKKRKDQ